MLKRASLRKQDINTLIRKINALTGATDVLKSKKTKGRIKDMQKEVEKLQRLERSL